MVSHLSGYGTQGALKRAVAQAGIQTLGPVV